jgi:hypothetical protein
MTSAAQAGHACMRQALAARGQPGLRRTARRSEARADGRATASVPAAQRPLRAFGAAVRAACNAHVARGTASAATLDALRTHNRGAPEQRLVRALPRLARVDLRSRRRRGRRQQRGQAGRQACAGEGTGSGQWHRHRQPGEGVRGKDEPSELPLLPEEGPPQHLMQPNPWTPSAPCFRHATRGVAMQRSVHKARAC